MIKYMSQAAVRAQASPHGTHQEGKRLGGFAKLVMVVTLLIIFGVFVLAAVGKGLLDTAEKLVPALSPERTRVSPAYGMVPPQTQPGKGKSEAELSRGQEAQVPSEATLHAFLENPLDRVLTTLFWVYSAGTLVSAPYCFLKRKIVVSSTDGEADTSSPYPDDE